MRFLKDPVNYIATGVNRFYGTESEERLVVITKGGKSYLKEKGEVVPLDVKVPYQKLVLKRTEKRYPADVDEVANKILEICSEQDVKYKGRIRKEKGDVLILDTNDGRIYLFTITRAHLIKAGEKKESETQRQLEIEYAGHLSGFNSFEKDSEKQIVNGLVDLANYIHKFHSSISLIREWGISLTPTQERRYDFVSQIKRGKRGKKTIIKIIRN